MRVLLNLLAALTLLGAARADDFTIAAFDTGGEVEYLTVGYENDNGVWTLEEIPVGYVQIEGTRVRLTMEETVGAECPECTGEVFRSTWVSGGITQTVETPRWANEPRVAWRRRHHANVEELAKAFPPDPPPPQEWASGTCATPHHQGGPAELAMLESGDLEASLMPQGEVALLVRSPFLAADPAPFGEGFLCLHPLHITREQAFNTWRGVRQFTPADGAYYQVLFRDCDLEEPISKCPGDRYNVTNVVDTRTAPAEANGESYTESFAIWPGYTSNDGTTKALKKFDGTLGTLLRVEFWYQPGGWRERGAENQNTEQDNCYGTSAETSHSDLTITSGIGCAPLLLGGYTTNVPELPPVQLTAYDGVLDFAGTSGFVSVWHPNVPEQFLATIQAPVCLVDFVDPDGAANGWDRFAVARSEVQQSGMITYCNVPPGPFTIWSYFYFGGQLFARYYYKAN